MDPQTGIQNPELYLTTPLISKEKAASHWKGRAIAVFGGFGGVGLFFWPRVTLLVCSISYLFFKKYQKTTLEKEIASHLESYYQGIEDDYGKDFSKIIAYLIRNKFSAVDARHFLHRISQANKLEKELLNELIDNYEISIDAFFEVLNGAYVLLEDNGSFYDSWKGKQGLRPRISSHESAPNTKQFSFQGNLVKEALFSEVISKEGRNRKTRSWIQLERTPFIQGKNPITIVRDFFSHTFDYLRYKYTRKNQGPFGSSRYTEAYPLLLQKKGFVTSSIGGYDIIQHNPLELIRSLSFNKLFSGG